MQEKPPIRCCRCGEPCQLASTTNENVRLLKHAIEPTASGWCPDCAATHFLKQESPLGSLIEGNGASGLQRLLDPRFQEQFAALMQAGKADASLQEITWQRVIENWHLPFTKKRRVSRRH